MQKIETIVGPYSIERYAPLFLCCQGALFIIGAFFWVDAVNGSTAFSPETWGTFAYGLSAEFWAMMNMSAATISLIGLLNPVHRKMVVVGGSMHFMQHLGLSYSAFFTGGDLGVGLYASFFFMPFHMIMTAGAISKWTQ